MVEAENMTIPSTLDFCLSYFGLLFFVKNLPSIIIAMGNTVYKKMSSINALLINEKV